MFRRTIAICSFLLVAHQSTAATAATPVRLSAPLQSVGDVVAESFEISPDGESLIYLADQDADSVVEAFVVPVGGGVVTKINASLTSGGKVLGAEFTYDSEHVIYHANQETLAHVELYSTAIGGTPLKLNRALPEFGAIGLCEFTTDGKVIYTGDQDTSGVLEAFVVPVNGGEPLKLNGSLILGGDVYLVGSDASESVVVYVADQEVDQQMELYGAAMDGAGAWKLSGPMHSNGNVNIKGVRVAPVGNRVVYVADPVQDEAFTLLSVPATGGEPVALTPNLVNGGDVLPNPVQISPLGDRVLYLADQDTDDKFEIYSVPIAGGPATRLNGSLISTGDVREESLQFSDDGANVLYIADQATNEIFELYVTPSTGGNSLKLSAPLVSGGDVNSATFSSDGEHVVYLADQQSNDLFELFGVPVTGGDPVRLNSALPAGRDVTSYEITPDGEHVVYLADQEADEKFELYMAPITGGEILKLSGELASSGDVKDWLISPDGQHVVYYADQLTDEQFELFSIPLFSDDQPGDFNGDGLVDAADYTVWRDGLGSEYDMNDYADWKNNFGENSTSGNTTAATVPEPASWVMLTCILAWIAMSAQSRKSCSASRAGTYSSVT